jgi:phage-related minor tail protein
MSKNFSVALSLLLNSAQYSQSLETVQQQTKSFASKVMGYIGGALAIGSVTAFVKSAIAGYNEAAQANARMNAVLLSTGGIAGVTGEQIKRMTSELSGKTLFGKTALTDASAILLTFTQIGREVFPEVLKAAVNMSTVLGSDLHSTFIQVGKAFNSPVSGMTALRRSGVSFSEAQTDLIKKLQRSGDLLGAQKIMLGELKTEFDGAAEAATKAGTGGIEMIIKKFNALKKAVGEAIVESKSFQTTISDIAKEMEEVVYVALSKNLSLWQKIKITLARNFGDQEGTDEADRLIRVAKAADEYNEQQKNAVDILKNKDAILKRIYDEEFNPKKPKVEKSDEEIKEEEKKRKEAFDRETAQLEAHKAERLTVFTDQYRTEKIIEATYNEESIIANIDFYKKQIDLLKKYGKDASSVRLQLAQEELKLHQSQTLQPVTVPVKSLDQTPQKEPSLIIDPKRQKEYDDSVDRENEIEEKAKKAEQDVKSAFDNINSTISSGLGEMVGQTAELLGEAFAEIFKGGSAADAFKNFANGILAMIGKFLSCRAG